MWRTACRHLCPSPTCTCMYSPIQEHVFPADSASMALQQAPSEQVQGQAARLGQAASTQLVVRLSRLALAAVSTAFLGHQGTGRASKGARAVALGFPIPSADTGTCGLEEGRVQRTQLQPLECSAVAEQRCHNAASVILDPA